MKNFAHWKNFIGNTVVGPEHGPIFFLLNIPEESSWNEVVEKWTLVCGVHVDDHDGVGFEKEWPREVQTQFAAGTGVRWVWSEIGDY